MNEEQKYKIIFVSEDNIEYYGEPGANTMHSIYLEEYIKKYFNEHPSLGKLTYQIGANSLAYALTYYANMAIVLNETRIGADGKPKYGTLVCLILPNKVSEKLKEQILSLSDSLKDFSKLYVEKTIVDENEHYLTGEIVPYEEDLRIEEKILNIIDKVNDKSSPSR